MRSIAPDRRLPRMLPAAAAVALGILMALALITGLV
jgi:hypothetical protein